MGFHVFSSDLGVWGRLSAFTPKILVVSYVFPGNLDVRSENLSVFWDLFGVSAENLGG